MSERIIGEGWWTRFELDELERRAFAAGKMEHDAALREAVEIIGWLRDHERTWTDEVWQRISAFLEKKE